MPPGRAIGELLWARSKQLWRGKGSHARQTLQSAKTSVHHQSTSTTTAGINAISSPSSGGRLVNLLVEALSPLLRAPGQAAARSGSGRTVYEPAARVVGRTIAARAGLHTAARPIARAGGVRPPGVPRATSQVGLGSARNFSSAKPIFQNVVQNAPLGLRVLGDADMLDMRKFKKEIKAAMLKRQASKGKDRASSNPFEPITMQGRKSEMAYYFSAASSDETKPSVQLLIPLNPVDDATSFLSLDKSTDGGDAFFSAMLMSDLRFLSELHGNHHAKLRNLIGKLESAGCFDVDPDTSCPAATAVLDEQGQKLVVTFYGERWSVTEVRQVLGFYEGQAWYELVDLGGSLPMSPLCSSILSDYEEPLSTSMSSDSSDVDDAFEHDRVSQSLYLPRIRTTSSDDSYIWGVEDFIHSLQETPRPVFRQRETI